MADDADVAESIVEQAVGALLPFSQTASSSSFKASKGLAGRGAGSKKSRMMSTGCTSIGMTATADTRTFGALPGVGRTTSGIGGGGQSGEDQSDTAVDGRKHGGGTRTRTGRNDGRYRRGASRGEEAGAAPFLDLDPPPSPTPPRRREYPDAAATPAGRPTGPHGPLGGGRGTQKERENVEGTRGSREGPDRLGRGLQAATTRSKAIGNVGSGGEDGYGRVGGGGGGGRDDAEGYVVLLTPTLAQIATLVEALEAPQLPTMGFVVVCPMYDWNQEQDEGEIRRLRKFPQVGKCRAGGT